MASTAHGRWGLLLQDSRNSQSKEFARSHPPSPLLSSEESESLSLAAARCWAMIILGAFFKCSLSSSLDHNIDSISMLQHHTENSLYAEKKKCNNPLHQKQLDGKAINISRLYLPRGEGRGRKRKREGPFLPTFPTLSPLEGLILRPPHSVGNSVSLSITPHNPERPGMTSLHSKRFCAV